MNDCFALLNEPRRPWLDNDALKRKFISLSAGLHPDRTHAAGEPEKAAAQERFANLNAAYNRLREPRDRLLHFLELELGSKPKDVQRIPADLIPLFNELNQICRQADAFLAEKALVTSPLLKVQMFDRSQECTEELAALQRRINSELDALLAHIQGIDADWKDGSDRAAVLARLEEFYRLLSYFTRWSDQLRERIVQLSF